MARKRRLYVAGVATALALGVASYGIAGGWDNDGPPRVPKSKKFHAELSGFQEVPAISTTGFGEFDMKLVNDTTLRYVFKYDDLEGGNSLFAHVHFGVRSTNGGVSFFLCGGSTKPDACPNVTGVVEGNIVAADVVGPGNPPPAANGGQGIYPGDFAKILRALRAGDAYVNIHTQRFPGGEIRGQINDRDQKELE